MKDYDSQMEDLLLRKERIEEAIMILSNPEAFDDPYEAEEMVEWAKNVIRNQGVYIPNQD